LANLGFIFGNFLQSLDDVPIAPAGMDFHGGADSKEEHEEVPDMPL